VVRYLELLENNPSGIAKGSFDRLCDYLEATGRRWIGDELRTELKTVRGELVIENYIRSETQRLVDAEFGQIRRLSGMEKVDIHKIVAQRTQHCKEVWGQLTSNTGRRESPTLARPAVPLAACVQRHPCTKTNKICCHDNVRWGIEKLTSD